VTASLVLMLHAHLPWVRHPELPFYMEEHWLYEAVAETGADASVIFVPPSSRNLQPDEVLDVEAVCRRIGNHAQVLADVAAIVGKVSGQARSGDYILILSNGGFDNIHRRLLQALADA